MNEAEKIRNFDKLSFEEQCALTGQSSEDFLSDAISRLFEKGLSIPEVALISGHKDVRMLFRYTHLKAEDILRRL